MPNQLSTDKTRKLKVLVWGTYDLGKPRTRIIIEALRNSGAEVTEIHRAVWEGAEDKSVLRKTDLLVRALRWILAYPVLIWRFLTAPRPDVVFIGYLGHLDVLILYPLAKIRRTPVVWDAFLSLYDTVVDDREMVSPRHPIAYLLKGWEWLACRAAGRVVLDTEAQAAMFREKYNLQDSRVTSVPVGAEANAFPVKKPDARAEGSDGQAKRSSVLFYGQFIPLHGIETIVEAARMAKDRPIDWTIIGTGQKAQDIRDMLSGDPIDSLEWKEWVPYAELTEHLSAADVCLGVFGDSEKAGRVIPNKVFQILSAGRPLVTRDGPGIRELVSETTPGSRLVPPADPAALLSAVEQVLDDAPYPSDLHAELRAQFSIEALAERWGDILEESVTQ